MEITTDVEEKSGFSEEELKQIAQLFPHPANEIELKLLSLIWPVLKNYGMAEKWLMTLPQEGTHKANNFEIGKAGIVEVGAGMTCAFGIAASNLDTLREVHDFTAFGIRTIAAISPQKACNPVAAIIGISEQSLIDTPKAVELGDKVFWISGNLKSNYSGSESVEEGWISSENALVEACHEAVDLGLIKKLHNVGELGAGKALAELSVSLEIGLSIYLDKFPRIVSNDFSSILWNGKGETFLVAPKGEESKIFSVFEKRGIVCSQIGEVAEAKELAFYFQKEKVAALPVCTLSPNRDFRYNDSGFRNLDQPKKSHNSKLSRVKAPKDYKAAAKLLFTSPNLVPKLSKFAFDMGAGTSDWKAQETSEAIILQSDKVKKSLVVSLSPNYNFTSAAPYVGAAIGVAKAAREIICSGGTPVAIANYFNFAEEKESGYNPNFVDAVKGIGDTGRKFGIPVVSNQLNIGQNNQGHAAKNNAIAPIIGMLGVLERDEDLTPYYFKSEGDLIYMLGNLYNDLGGSEYLRAVLGIQQSSIPKFDPHEEQEVQGHVRKLIQKKIVNSARSVSGGGLFFSLMESAIVRNLGFQIETVETFRKDCFLFGESQSRVVISISEKDEDELQNYLIGNNVSFTKLGEIIGNDAIINNENFGSVSSWKTMK